MEISSLTLKLIVLLIPGAIAAKIFQIVTVNKPWSEFQFVVNSIILGVISYLTMQFLIYTPTAIVSGFCGEGWLPPAKPLEIWGKLSEGGSIPYSEVFWAGVISVGIGILVSLIDNHKWINQLAQRVSLSNKYGDQNLYSYFLNAKETQVVYVRHAKRGLTFHGSVQSYSETDNIKELVLYDVTVYTYPDSEELYSINQLYLSIPKEEDVVIETANLINNEQAESAQ